LAVVFALSAAVQTASAQSTLFSEDFTTSNYDVALTLPWAWVNIAPVSPVSGGHYLETGVPRNPGNSNNIYSITLDVSTLDYNNISLNWQERHLDGTQGNKVPDVRSLYYRVNK